MRLYTEEMSAVFLDRKLPPQVDSCYCAVDVDASNQCCQGTQDNLWFDGQHNILLLIIKLLNVGLCADLPLDRVEWIVLNLQIT